MDWGGGLFPLFRQQTIPGFMSASMHLKHKTSSSPSQKSSGSQTRGRGRGLKRSRTRGLRWRYSTNTFIHFKTGHYTLHRQALTMRHMAASAATGVADDDTQFQDVCVIAGAR